MLGNYDDGSLHPPTARLKSGDRDGPLEEVLLENYAYVVDEQNHTTTTSKTRGGKDMQVTFFLTPPPRVSYFSCVCTEDVAEFVCEPSIIAAVGSLALIVLSPRSSCGLGRTEHDYYVYRAPAVRPAGGRPMLRLLGHPDPDLFLHGRPYYFHDDEVGLLPYRINNRDDYEYEYMVAAICARYREPDRYDLYTYDSTTQDWARESAALPEPERRQLSGHRCERVITVGGDAGTMGWVDFGRGIILCDLLRKETNGGGPKRLRYIKLPDPIQPDNRLRCTPRWFRDIACVQGRIKLFELQMDIRRPCQCSRTDGPYVQTGWTGLQWSRTAEDDSSDWCLDKELSASEIIVPAHVQEMLPRLPDNGGKGTVLERLHVKHPRLSLLPGRDDVVSLMAKLDESDHDSWMISLDMKKNTLLGVAQFATQRRFRIFRQTTISKYLTTALGSAEHNMKRPGVSLPGFPHKKLPPTSSRYHHQQVEGTGEGMDDMDLD